MTAFDVSPATVIIGLIVIALAVLAVRRLWRKGMCDCHSDSPRGGCGSGCSGCAGCATLDKMVVDLDGLSGTDTSVKQSAFSKSKDENNH